MPRQSIRATQMLLMAEPEKRGEAASQRVWQAAQVRLQLVAAELQQVLEGHPDLQLVAAGPGATVARCSRPPR